MAPERLAWAEDRSVADGCSCCMPEWNGWGALIRQPPTQIVWMLIALWGAVWQQARWLRLGISLWGYIRTVHIFLQSPHWMKYQSYVFIYAHFWFDTDKDSLSRFLKVTDNSLHRSLHLPSIFFSLFCVSLFCSSWVMSLSSVLWVTFKDNINPALYGIVQR